VASSSQAKGKGPTSVVIDNLDLEDIDENIHEKGTNCLISLTCTDHCSDVFPGKTKCATLGNPVAVDADGLLMDVDVQSIDDSPPTREDKRQDVDHFFRTAIVKDVNGKSKKYRACKLCP
jgi:hypothetical protein